MNLSFLPPVPAEPAAKQEWAKQSAELVRDHHRGVRNQSMLLAWMRFLAFAGVLVGIYFYSGRGATSGIAMAIGSLLVFVFCVRLHGRVKNRATTLQFLQALLDESMSRLNQEPTIIRSGTRPAEPEVWDELFQELDAGQACHPLSAQEIGDLDLFSDTLSLFGVLNRTSSPIGACRLSHGLTRPLMSRDHIRERQDATKWMRENTAARLHFMAAAAGLRRMEADCRNLYLTLRHATPLGKRGLISVVRAWGLAGPVALILAIANQAGWDGIQVGWSPFVAVLMINAVLIQFFLKPIRDRVRPWLHLDEVVPRLMHIAETGLETLPSAGILGRQRQRFQDALGPNCLPALNRRIPLLFLSLSGVMHVIIEVLMFWDIQVLCALEKCYIKHRRELINAIAALGVCEYYASLGSFAWEQPVIAWPDFSEENWHLEIDHGLHPLIASSESVSNSLELGGDVRTWVITGSNMSGKSTFLRMAATNVLLSQIGSAATAERMVHSPLEILSDLRIRDELSRKESYFLAEVRQVRRMVMAARENRPIMALIDEPFRGTNSAERVASAWAVVTDLTKGSGIHLVATHDAVLAELGNADYARNFHFQEALDRDQLVFDYKLRPGPARSRNAIRVLEVEKYPEELVAQARQLVDADESDREQPSH